MIRKIINAQNLKLISVYVFLVVSYIVLGVIIYWAFLDESPPAIILNIKQIDDKKNDLTMRISIVKLRSCLSDNANTVSRFLTKDNAIEGSLDTDTATNGAIKLENTQPFETEYPKTKILGHHTIIQSYDIPKDIDSGYWYYYFISNYRCHPLNNILVVSPIAKVRIK